MTTLNCEQAVLVALSRFPMTVVELAHETGYARRSVQAAIQALHGEQVYIVKYDDSNGLIAYPTPVYKLGKGKDAARAQRSNAVRCARSREKRRRNRVPPFPLGDVWQNVAAA
ncbi:hypothetical protein [Burkholderia pseudomallei]|uniref:hypothetical protein n=1 Tax=Burkholderia pseudomallei TaxID=28450 RepID=UPI0005100263|nr:hypothetical protein [Burkholderia pseudomallei]AJX61330.1 hypothetical protein DP47_3349 [Burkholderia pseudomallei Pasteur 52237]MWA22323.1 hypothetical protein [Burkholderia pseudomallei]VBQ80715.1 transcriptional regulator [Burkholderia pseudomallei]